MQDNLQVVFECNSISGLKANARLKDTVKDPAGLTTTQDLLSPPIGLIA